MGMRPVIFRSERMHGEVHLWGALSAILYLYVGATAPTPEAVDGLLLLFCLLCGIYSRVAVLCNARDDRGTLVSILLWAMVFRCILLVAQDSGAAVYSSDVFRYLWEGEVTRAGFNPYLLAPDSELLRGVREGVPAIWASVDHKAIPAIYPPAAQLIFRVIPGEVLCFQIFAVVGDLLLHAMLLFALCRSGQPSGRIIWYSWLPLILLELVRSPHLEALGVPCMVLGLLCFNFARRYVFLWSAVFSVAVMMKYVALIPFGYCALFHLQRTPRLRTVLEMAIPVFIVALLCSYPFRDAGIHIFSALQTYASHWRFNGLIFRALEVFFESMGIHAPAALAKGTALLICVLAFFHLLLRGKEPIEATMRLILISLLLAPVLYPWYLLWVLPLVVLSPASRWGRYVLCLSCTVLLSYEVLRHPDSWELSWGLLLLEYVSPLLFFLFQSRCGALPSKSLVEEP